MLRIWISVSFAVVGLLSVLPQPSPAQHHHHSGHSGFHSGHSGFHSGHFGFHSGHSGFHSGHLGHHTGHWGHHSGHWGHHSGLHFDFQPHYSIHPFGHYGGGFHYDSPLYSAYGRYVTDHHHDYRFVVPSYGDYGAFYSYGNECYYTPAAVSGRHTVYRPQPVEFGHFSHADELSKRLERAANELCLDLYYNYSHNSGFKETYREAYQFLVKAKYIHGSEHGGDQQVIQQTMGEMDVLFHHVVEDLQGWSRHVHRPVGHGGAGPKVAAIEALLHHVMYDAGVRPQHDAVGEPASAETGNSSNEVVPALPQPPADANATVQQ